MQLDSPSPRTPAKQSQQTLRSAAILTAAGSSADLRRSRQIHFWVSSRDYVFLRNFANQEGESMASLLRRIVRKFRCVHDTEGDRSTSQSQEKFSS
jgi:hypothetical protein